MRQMQQQTRQRPRRQRKSTPLPKKRGGKRQTTNRCHANRTLRHMVNHPPPFQQRKSAEKKKGGGSRTEEKTRQQGKTQWCSGITCVLAGLRAHYPEHQHTRKKKKRKKKIEKTSNENYTPITHRHSNPHINHHRYSTMTHP